MGKPVCNDILWVWDRTGSENADQYHNGKRPFCVGDSPWKRVCDPGHLSEDADSGRIKAWAGIPRGLHHR